jgi:hypothetical protein
MGNQSNLSSLMRKETGNVLELTAFVAEITLWPFAL